MTTQAVQAVPETIAAETARRDRLVLEHLPLVKAIARRVYQNVPMHVDVDDLVHAGVMGLIDAANKFNSGKQVEFSTYAKHRIKGAILDSLRQLDWASRGLRRLHKKVEAATRELTETLQRTPTDQEMAERLGYDMDQWRQVMIDLRNVGLVSGSTRPVSDEDLSEPEFEAKPDTRPDTVCARQQMHFILGTALQALPERYRKVMTLYYTDELSMKEIGNLLGVNESRVSQIHKLAIGKMHATLQANGITSSYAFAS